MITSELAWIAVPGGTVANGNATLRVLIVPRLQSDTPRPLSDFAMEDWPALLAATTLRVETAADAEAERRTITATLAASASSDVWRSFFAADMTVKPWQQRSYAPPAVDQTSKNAAKIVRNYTDSARAFANPDIDPAAVVRDQYAQWRDDEPPAEPPGELAPEAWKAPDFHRTVSLLREHPTVLKQLGLIIEIALPADEIPRTATGTPQLIRVQCSLDATQQVEFPMITPWTRFEFDGVHFLPAPAENSDVSKGMIVLTGTRLISPASPNAPATKWSMVTFDVDGGVGRLRDGARSGGARPGAPGGVSLPVLHSAGLTLLRHGRGDVLRERADNSRRNNGSGSLARRELTADDLVLGYRIDIRGQSSEWAPLCERQATYWIGSQTIGPEAQVEEGHAKANAAVVGADKVLRADEVVTRWSGWNLAIPRPIFDEQGVRPSEAKRLDLPFDFRWEFKQARQQLPKLRFGKGYRMRIRIADMAGGGLAFGELTGNDRASDLVLYRRHEAIPPPEIAPPEGMFVVNDAGQTLPNPAALGPGGSIDSLVIRSDPAGDVNLDVEQFGIQHPSYPRNDGRILLPPPSSMALAEQHGFLDGDDAVTWSWVKRAIAPPTASPDGKYTWLPDPAAAGVMIYVRPHPDSPAPTATADSLWKPQWPDLTPKTLRLRPAEAGRPVIEWASNEPAAGVWNELLARLKPAEQVDLEITSYPNAENIDQFEVSEWLPSEAESQVVEGRHPMVTPPRVVQLVHAVRRPLKVPFGTLEARRKPGETSAVLCDPADPKLGIDPASTSQVDVAAQWKETSDNTNSPRTERVTSLKVERAAERLPELRHEFGDTRHRRITYTLTALSRFRQFFEATPNDDQAFRSENTLAEVRIPNSARPAPPVVLAATPSFRWQGTGDPIGLGQPVRRKRLGGGVRIELARPWNLTGEGEQLAAVVWPNAEAGTESDSAGQHITRLFRDPIWSTPFPSGLAQESMFVGMTSRSRECTLVETGQKVLAVPFAVHFREASNRWHADIQLPQPAAASYLPFVRLALVRYQPESLPGLELSATVTTDFVPLMPDRTLSIQRIDGGLQVLLEGLGPLAPRPNRVIAAIERCVLRPGTSATASDLAAASPDTIGMWHRLQGQSVSGVLNTPLPSLPLPAVDGLLRLIVREIEDIETAFESNEDDSLASELSQRTVFLDIIEL